MTTEAEYDRMCLAVLVTERELVTLRVERDAATHALHKSMDRVTTLCAELDQVQSLWAADREARFALRAELSECREHSATRLTYLEQYKSEAATLRAERLLVDEGRARWESAESRLATATELLARSPGRSRCISESAWCEDVTAFLAAGQPAAPARRDLG